MGTTETREVGGNRGTTVKSVAEQHCEKKLRERPIRATGRRTKRRRGSLESCDHPRGSVPCLGFRRSFLQRTETRERRAQGDRRETTWRGTGVRQELQRETHHLLKAHMLYIYIRIYCL